MRIQLTATVRSIINQLNYTGACHHFHQGCFLYSSVYSSLLWTKDTDNELHTVLICLSSVRRLWLGRGTLDL